MPHHIIQPIIRTVIAYFLILVLARVMGRKMVSQMTFFDFVVGITIGSVGAGLAIGPYNSILSSIVALCIFAILTILIDYIHIKSIKFRKLIDSEPIVVIKNGKIINENLLKERYTVDELTMMLREKDIFNISDVEFALIEYDGKLTVLPKSQKRPVRPADLDITTTYEGLTKDLIIDGKILEENLRAAQKDEQWLTHQLMLWGIHDPGNVFYAGLDSSGKLYVSKKDSSNEQPGQYGIE